MSHKQIVAARSSTRMRVAQAFNIDVVTAVAMTRDEFTAAIAAKSLSEKGWK